MEHFWSREEGQGVAEYGWTLLLVAILIVVILVLLGLAVFDLWEVIADSWTDIWSSF
jgi:Flp pilus assembly pilin Flp